MRKCSFFVLFSFMILYGVAQPPAKYFNFQPFNIGNDVVFYDSVRHWQSICEYSICQYNNGAITGKVMIFNMKINKLYGDVQYYLGYKNGEANLYNRKGKVYVKAFFKYDTLNGPYTIYNRKGHPMMITNYKNGLRDGQEIILKSNGDTIRINNFKKGFYDGVQIYFKHGKRKREKYYNADENFIMSDTTSGVLFHVREEDMFLGNS